MLSGKYAAYYTTPIFYINALPHIGHAYSLVLADAVSKYDQLKKNPSTEAFSHSSSLQIFTEPNSLISVGTDEHGNKIFNASIKAGLPQDQFSKKMSDLYKKFCLSFIPHGHFIRTSEPRHIESVKEFWSDSVFLDSYKGWYSTSDETFFNDYEIETIGGRTISKDTNNPVEWISEYTYKFRLMKFKDFIRDWLQNGSVFGPKTSRQVRWQKEALNYVDSIQDDLSISRPLKRVHWAISVPDKPDYTIYVWLDALVNYLTVCGFPNNLNACWPPRVQVFGKDILKFHAVIWPALLKALNLPLPQQLICHGHILINNVKVSLGNVVDAMEEPFSLGWDNLPDISNSKKIDALRFHLLTSPLTYDDWSYSRKLAQANINAKLVNTFINLFARVTGPKLNHEQKYFVIHPKDLDQLNLSLTKTLYSALVDLSSKFDYAWVSEMAPNLAIEQVYNCLYLANQLVEVSKPWHKSCSDDRRKIVLGAALETLRLSAHFLYPIVPVLCREMLTRLGFNENNLVKSSQSNDLTPISGVILTRTNNRTH